MSTATATTPGRVTHLILDPPYTSLSEFPLAFLRVGVEIARAGFGTNNSDSVMRYGNGGIGLRPFQMEAGRLAQTPAGAAAIMTPSDFDIPPDMGLVTRPLFRQQTELPGVTYDAGVVSSGDGCMVKIISAAQSWAQDIIADRLAFGAAAISPQHVPLDRIMVGRVTFAENSGFCWRFSVSATQKNSPQVLGVTYFGGPVDDSNNGQFALAPYGTGMAELWQGAGEDWTVVNSFRYASPDRICGTMHQILWKPYNAPAGTNLGHIDFIVNTTDQSQTRGSLVQSYYNEPATQNIFTHYVPRFNTAVTGASNIRHDQPRDQRPYNQFSVLRYPAAGHFTDFAFFVPFFLGTLNDIILTWEAVVPAGCSLLGRLYNAVTETELTLVSSTANSRTYEFPAGGTHFYTRFEYESDGNDTPILSSYRVNRNGTIIAAGEDNSVDVPVVTSVSVSGAEQDPSHETSAYTIEDLTASLDALKFRGRVPYRHEVEYDATDDTKRSVISDGFFLRSTGRRRGGKRKEGFGGAGATRLYPAERWTQYMATGVGNWLRLKEKIAIHLFDFSPNSALSDSPGNAVKITDAVYALISYCGFTDDQIDVPDNPMRFMPREGQSAQDTFCVMPGQEIGQIVVDLLRDYLGWFLVWDGNAGDNGMWRAFAPKTPPYTNLATFYTTKTPGVPQLVNHAKAWGNTETGYWSESGAVNGFIRRKTLETFVKPPEANAVLVIGGGTELSGKTGNAIIAQCLINRDGLNYFPDYVATPTENPDWIGELLPLLVVDFTLGTQAAVDYFCWRIFHIACHGIKCARFEAPLLLVTDAADTLQRVPRPLRYYDPVKINDNGTESQWLVRNVNPGYRRDAHQLALYELEAPRPPYV
jgi:hypothetical protein